MEKILFAFDEHSQFHGDEEIIKRLYENQLKKYYHDCIEFKIIKAPGINALINNIETFFKHNENYRKVVIDAIGLSEEMVNRLQSYDVYLTSGFSSEYCPVKPSVTVIEKPFTMSGLLQIVCEKK